MRFYKNLYKALTVIFFRHPKNSISVLFKSHFGNAHGVTVIVI